MTRDEQVVSRVGDKQLELVQKVDAHLPPLRGDCDKAVRTLVNLLGNAIRSRRAADA